MKKKKNNNHTDIFIDGIQYLKGENIGEVIAWFARHGSGRLLRYHAGQNEYRVRTPDGTHVLSHGDLIVREMGGHFRVFEAERIVWHSSIRR